MIVEGIDIDTLILDRATGLTVSYMMIYYKRMFNVRTQKSA